MNQGQKVKIEFTYENNGSNTKRTNLGVYVSTNDLITTADTKIANVAITLDPDVIFTHQDLVTIPASIPHNSFRWLGVIIDDANTIPDFCRIE